MERLTLYEKSEDARVILQGCFINIEKGNYTIKRANRMISKMRNILFDYKTRHNFVSQEALGLPRKDISEHCLFPLTAVVKVIYNQCSKDPSIINDGEKFLRLFRPFSSMIYVTKEQKKLIKQKTKEICSINNLDSETLINKSLKLISEYKFYIKEDPRKIRDENYSPAIVTNYHIKRIIGLDK